MHIRGAGEVMPSKNNISVISFFFKNGNPEKEIAFWCI